MAKILVVDDRRENREYLVTLLGHMQHEVLEASDGAEALQLVGDRKPDLVITDILMPTMDGYEFVRQLRLLPQISHTEIIFWTADYHGREARNLAQACGVSHLLIKPSEPEVVMRTIQAALGGGDERAPATAPSEAFDREHMRLLTDKLSEKTEALQAVNQRLAELIEVNLQLSSENHADRLLEKVCRSARNLVGAKYAAVAVANDLHAAPDYFVTSGMDTEMQRTLGTATLKDGVLGELLSQRRTYRSSHLQGDPAAMGLPQHYPAVHSLLGARIASAAHTYGWLCLTDKVGGDDFSEEDEQLTELLAAQVGRIYENRTLYAEVHNHAEKLLQEVNERRKAENEVRTLNRELERRVQERTAQLEAANRELESFSYSVSHDLRAPLRAIDGFAAILQEDFLDSLPAEAQHCVRTIRNNAVRMGRLIDDLLQFSRLSQQPLHTADVDLAKAVEEAWRELACDREGRRVEFSVAALPAVRADHALLRQALYNLLSNACKFTRGRDPAIVEFGWNGQAAEPVFHVKDNGVGFDMEYAGRLFGVFQRLHRQDEFEGTGVGLSLVQRIVQRHGGRIWADAARDRGAVFYFTLPRGDLQST